MCVYIHISCHSRVPRLWCKISWRSWTKTSRTSIWFQKLTAHDLVPPLHFKDRIMNQSTLTPGIGVKTTLKNFILKDLCRFPSFGNRKFRILLLRVLFRFKEHKTCLRCFTGTPFYCDIFHLCDVFHASFLMSIAPSCQQPFQTWTQLLMIHLASPLL